MPVLDLVECRVCASVLHWERGVGKYVVKWGKAPLGYRYEYAYSCTCPGFTFRKHCKHVEASKSLRCNWGSEAFSGSFKAPNLNGSCPKCGGPTVVVRVGV